MPCFINHQFHFRIQGQYQYFPNTNKPSKRLYRTNPSIPRPESRYGAKSSIYEQIIEIKRQTTDSTGNWEILASKNYNHSPFSLY